MRMKKTLLLVYVLTIALSLAIWSCTAGAVPLTWDAATDNIGVTGYKIYKGTASGIYDSSEDVGNVTSYVVTVPSGGTWFFVVTAYDAAGNESGPSNEVSDTVDTTSPVMGTLRIGTQ